VEWLTDPQALMALFTLTLLEVVLGIDNVIFISILSGKLPEHQQEKARITGLTLAMVTRIILLFSLTWILGLTKPLFSVFTMEVSGRDIILILGGFFLLGKATYEIHDKLEGEEGHQSAKIYPTFRNVIIQILLLDIVFSLDSVITAVGMADQLIIMIIAVVIAVIFMIVFSGKISRFIETHPSLKILALSFLILIGFTLVADGFGQHISKGYIYSAMAFSVFVEVINIKLKGKRQPVELHKRYTEGQAAG
jgi:predicted tellurium resistance membrane protein TerC